MTTTKAVTKYPIYENCTKPFTYFEPSHSCYGVGNFTGPMNWSSGEIYCEQYGAHLASIHSYDELYFLGSMVNIGHTALWVGAFSNDGGKTWAWSDRSVWDYNPFYNGYPKLQISACGRVWSAGIVDEVCTDLSQIICKKSL
uniref:C-type lectin domain-containing protein n=1 Tax=Panagrolaimus sp. PS1159 TaxID=55785 RepID=A0AC35FVP5_9BILA